MNATVAQSPGPTARRNRIQQIQLRLILPILVHAAFLASLYFLSWAWLLVGFLVGYILIANVGGEIANHRYFCHNSFKTGPIRRWILLVLGGLCGAGAPLNWAIPHRLHHLHADTEKDPHSPLVTSPRQAWFGFYRIESVPPYVIKDLTEDKLQRFLLRNYFLLYLALFAALSLMNFKLALFTLGWGGFFSFHLIGIVNTISHLRGPKNYSSAPGTNHALLARLTLGTALHNNHHAHPTRYRFNQKPGEIDVWGWIIGKLFATG